MQSEPHLPLRLEELQQHGVCVEPLCNCLCNLGERTRREVGTLGKGRCVLKKRGVI